MDAKFTLWIPEKFGRKNNFFEKLGTKLIKKYKIKKERFIFAL